MKLVRIALFCTVVCTGFARAHVYNSADDLKQALIDVHTQEGETWLSKKRALAQMLEENKVIIDEVVATSLRDRANSLLYWLFLERDSHRPCGKSREFLAMHLVKKGVDLLLPASGSDDFFELFMRKHWKSCNSSDKTFAKMLLIKYKKQRIAKGDIPEGRTCLDELYEKVIKEKEWRFAHFLYKFAKQNRIRLRTVAEVVDELVDEGDAEQELRDEYTRIAPDYSGRRARIARRLRF